MYIYILKTQLVQESSPVEGVVLWFLPGQDVSSPDVKVDLVQGRVQRHNLTAIGHAGALEDGG